MRDWWKFICSINFGLSLQGRHHTVHGRCLLPEYKHFIWLPHRILAIGDDLCKVSGQQCSQRAYTKAPQYFQHVNPTLKYPAFKCSIHFSLIDESRCLLDYCKLNETLDLILRLKLTVVRCPLLDVVDKCLEVIMIQLSLNVSIYA